MCIDRYADEKKFNMTCSKMVGSLTEQRCFYAWYDKAITE